VEGTEGLQAADQEPERGGKGENPRAENVASKKERTAAELRGAGRSKGGGKREFHSSERKKSHTS